MWLRAPVFLRAIITGLAIGAAGTVPWVAVAAVYGTLAHLTDSTLPSMVLHAGGNVLGAFGLLVRGRSEWQLSVAPPPLIWETGLDTAFWGNLAAFLIVAVAAVWAYHTLAVAERTAQTAEAA